MVENSLKDNSKFIVTSDGISPNLFVGDLLVSAKNEDNNAVKVNSSKARQGKS